MANRNITADWLRANYDYNPETGEFFTKPKKIGYKGFYGKNRDPYIAISIRTTSHTKFYAHRLAWLWMTGRWPNGVIDHANNDTTDNRWSNLRDATSSENGRNKGQQRNNTSGFTGAYWANDRKRWFSRIDKRGGYLGTFESAEKAHEAYKRP